MTNEELVNEIQNGNISKKVVLWNQVKQAVVNIAKRVMRAMSGSQVYEYDDLIQIGYLVLEKAIDTYDVSADYKFITHFWYMLKTEIAKQTGFRTAAQRADPIRSTLSLNSTISTETEEVYCLQDLLQDPNDYYEPIEECDFENWRRSIIEEAMKSLNENEKKVIRWCYYENKTQNEIALLLGVSYQRISQIKNMALAKLRRNESLQKLYLNSEDQKVDQSYHCSLSDQRRTGYSMVEKIVESRFRKALTNYSNI